MFGWVHLRGELALLTPAALRQVVQVVAQALVHSAVACVVSCGTRNEERERDITHQLPSILPVILGCS